jgi:hypothetical protein
MGANLQTTTRATDLETTTRSTDVSETGTSILPEEESRPKIDRRAWTLKGIRSETVMQSRKAAQTQGMLLSLWVEKQLRQAAERELKGDAGKSLAADIMCTKIENVESALKGYLQDQEERIAELQKAVRNLTDIIVPPLLKALSSDRSRKRA